MELNWEKIVPNGRDYKANVPYGVYFVSVDSYQAGGAAYLWVPGQTDDDDYYMHYDNRFQAMKAAEAHYVKIQS